jgi:hypothetical protein
MPETQQSSRAERRVHPRLDDVMASLVEWGENQRAIVLNVSEGGMAVYSAEDLDGNYFSNVRFRAPESGEWIETSGELAWISKSKKRAGIRFASLTAEARERLRAGISIATMRASAVEATADFEHIDVTSQLEQAGQQEPAEATAQEIVRRANGEAERAEMPTWLMGNTSASADASEHTPASMENAALEKQVEVEASRQYSAREGDGELSLAEHLPRGGISERSAPSIEIKKSTSTQVMELPVLERAAQQKPVGIDQQVAQKTYREIPEWASSLGDAMPLPMQKVTPAELVQRGGRAGEVARESVYAQAQTWTRYETGYRSWIVVAAVALLAATVAFLLGWIAGDPSILKLGR